MVTRMSIEKLIEQKLSVLNPTFLTVENESHMHSVPENSETHFKVVIVAEHFEELRLVKRHQAIYQSGLSDAGIGVLT